MGLYYHKIDILLRTENGISGRKAVSHEIINRFIGYSVIVIKDTKRHFDEHPYKNHELALLSTESFYT